ncbi:MAG TPA: hypothetical protein PKO06_23410, partial [Candidatus Ozemobacteraceae bacterium]|nr:hypothetical protein [Candidatus Ozemobacteraceae bacterium]
MKARVTIVAVDTFRIAGESAPYGGQQYHGRLLNHLEIPGLLDCGESGNPVRSLSIDVRNIDNWIRPAVQNLWGAIVIVDVDGINETWVGKVTGYNQSRTGVLSIDAGEDSLAIFKLPLPDETVHLINWPDAEGEAIDTAVNMPFGGTVAQPVRVKAILVDRVRFIYLISVGTIRQVVRVLKNREELADGYSTTLGTEVQALYPGYAYVRFDADPRDSSGNWPEVLVDVLGLVVGSVDVTECRNPARILKHLLITPRTGACGWGLGVPQSMINEAAFDQAIADCDDAGLLLDGCFFAKREAAYWLNELWMVGRIKLTIEAGKWTPRVEKPGVSERTFTGNSLQPVSWGKGASNERKNLVKLYYFWDISRDRLIRSVKRNDPTGHAGSQDRLGIQETEVEAVLVQDATTAQKICDFL